MIVYQHSKCEKAIISLVQQSCGNRKQFEEKVRKGRDVPLSSGAKERVIRLCGEFSYATYAAEARWNGRVRHRLFQSTLEASRLLILHHLPLAVCLYVSKKVHNFLTPNKKVFHDNDKIWQDLFFCWNEAWNDQPTPLVLNIVLILLMQSVYIIFIYCVYIYNIHLKIIYYTVLTYCNIYIYRCSTFKW